MCTSFGSFGGTVYIATSLGSPCFTYIDIAISPCATLICIHFDFLDIVVYLPKALLICYLFFYLLIRRVTLVLITLDKSGYPCFDKQRFEIVPRKLER